MSHWGKWSQEAKQVARLIKQLRAQGNTEPLALVEEKELLDNRVWLAKRDYENQLMQRVIIGTTKYESICQACEDHEECKREQKDKRGCEEWWLRWLTEEEEKACIDRATAPGAVREHTNEDEGEALPPGERMV